MAINKGSRGGIRIDDAQMSYINNWEINFAGDVLDASAFGDDIRDRDFIPGLRNPTVTFSGYADITNTAQNTLVDYQKRGSTMSNVTVICAHERGDTSVRAAGWSGSGPITGLTVGTPVDGLAAFSGTVQISGGLTTYSFGGSVLEGLLLGDLVVGTT